MSKLRGSLVYLLCGAATVLLGGVFVILGLEKGDQVASGIGAAAAIAGVVLSWLARPRRADRAQEDSGQTTVEMLAEAHDDSRIYQVGQGDLTIGKE